MEEMSHGCPKKPSDLIFDTIVREADGKWWRVRNGVTGGIVHVSVTDKIKELTDGICPWCKANLVLLAKNWPHKCRAKGKGARKLVASTRQKPKQVELKIDNNNPTRALYTVTFTLNVKACPDCGKELF